MTAACPHCHDTGSLSKDIEGQLDCAYCSVADERTELEAWAKAQAIDCRSVAALWLIYQHGKGKDAAVVAPRYKVVDASQSAHCCFECTVVDTAETYMINGNQYEDRFEPMCETFGRADADLICAALNAYQPAP